VVLRSNVLQRVADSPVEVALAGHVILVRVRHVVDDVGIRRGAVRHYGNPGSVRTDREMMQQVLYTQSWHVEVASRAVHTRGHVHVRIAIRSPNGTLLCERAFRVD